METFWAGFEKNAASKAKATEDLLTRVLGSGGAASARKAGEHAKQMGGAVKDTVLNYTKQNPGKALIGTGALGMGGGYILGRKRESQINNNMNVYRV